jgi:uncharacterized protein
LLTTSVLIAIVSAIVVYVYARWIEPLRIQYHEVPVYLDDLDAAFDGYRIAVLSDIHWNPRMQSRRWIRRIVQRTHALKPDIIVLCGDIVDCHAAGSVANSDNLTELDEVAKLVAPDGVFAVLGNHDFGPRKRMGTHVRTELERVGIPELWNQSTPVCRDGKRIWFGGTGDWWRDVCDVQGAFEGVPDDEPRILLAHNPDTLLQTDGTRVDLMLSGHTHGGQVRVPFLGAIVTRTRLGRAASAGLVRSRNTQVYISRGISTGESRIRFNCRPELPLIVLRVAK